MKDVPLATKEELRIYALEREGHTLPRKRIRELEEQITQKPTLMDSRIQLLGFYTWQSHNETFSKSDETRLFEHVYWLISNTHLMDSAFGMHITFLGSRFSPPHFAKLRALLLAKVEESPEKGRLLGCAAMFVGSVDLETALPLYERAYTLQPRWGWMEFLVMQLHSEFFHSAEYYKTRICERLIESSQKAFKADPNFIFYGVYECTCDAALYIGEHEVVRYCANALIENGEDRPEHSGWFVEQIGRSYLGLVALRENKLVTAREMLKPRPNYTPQNPALRLAKELYEIGEVEPVIDFINRVGKLNKKVKSDWLEQIANKETPDFMSYNRIKTKTKKRRKK